MLFSRKSTEPKPAASETAVIASAPEAAETQQPVLSKRLDASFGQIVALLLRSPHYRERTLADLEWLVLPELLP